MVKEVNPDPDAMERHRIISFDKSDPSHVAYDILRTKTVQALQERGWKSLAISSPTASCGKSTVAINLAISMARQEACRTVLIDLDLRRPAVGKMLGVQAEKPLGYYIEGQAELEESFVRIEKDLFVGLNTYRIRNSAEMMRHVRVRGILPTVLASLDPTIVIFDLPPMLASDDAIAFLPQVDCGMLVAESGKTTAKQIEECAQQFGSRTEFLGLILNKCREPGDESFPYVGD